MHEIFHYVKVATPIALLFYAYASAKSGKNDLSYKKFYYNPDAYIKVIF